MEKKLFWMCLILALTLLLASGCGKQNLDKVTITYTDTECKLSGPKAVPAGMIEMDWNTTSDAHEKYGLAILRLDEGKSIDDLREWKSMDQMPWSELISFRESKGKMTTELFINEEAGPLYFVCFNSEQVIGALGPVDISK